jgi:hypothetical protein
VHPNARVPKWCESRSDASGIESVHFSAEAAAAIAAAAEAGSLRFYQDAASAQQAIAQSLQLDIRSVFQGRGGVGGGANGGGVRGGVGRDGAGGVGAGGTVGLFCGGKAGAPVDTAGQKYSFRFDALVVEFETSEASVLVTRCQMVTERAGNHEK